MDKLLPTRKTLEPDRVVEPLWVLAPRSVKFPPPLKRKFPPPRKGPSKTVSIPEFALARVAVTPAFAVIVLFAACNTVRGEELDGKELKFPFDAKVMLPEPTLPARSILMEPPLIMTGPDNCISAGL